MNLTQCANQVLQEFGGVAPEELLSFEDAKREFLAVRALELQKLNIAGTDKTVGPAVLSATTRSAVVPTGTFGNYSTPAFVEIAPTSDTTGNVRCKVEIMPVEDIPDHEGDRCIAFYGTPQQYRLSWDSWKEGRLYVWFDSVEDLTTVQGSTTITFPDAFWFFLIKKSALSLIRVLRLKITMIQASDPRTPLLLKALDAMEPSLTVQVAEWQREFRKFTNLDMNEQPHLRRSIEEIWRRGSSEDYYVPGEYF